jgi:hypothetical protein
MNVKFRMCESGEGGIFSFRWCGLHTITLHHTRRECPANAPFYTHNKIGFVSIVLSKKGGKRTLRGEP